MPLFAACGGKAIDRTNRTGVPDAGGRRPVGAMKEAGIGAGDGAVSRRGTLVASPGLHHNPRADASAPATGIPLDGAFLGTPDGVPSDERTSACRHGFLQRYTSPCG